MDAVMFGSILSASLLGSLHCAGMCGGLMAFSSGRDSSGSGVSLQVAYHVGRLAIYVALGALAGALGEGLNLAGALLEWQHTAALVGASWMVLWGAQALAKQLGGWRGIPNPLSRLTGRVVPIYRSLYARPGPRSALLIGLLTGLLPCGWLYLFVGAAAGSAHPLTGAAMMGVFWMGTVPALASVGLVVRRVSGPLRRYLPTFTATLLVVAGLYTIVQKLETNRATSSAASFAVGASSTLSPGTHLCGAPQP